MYFFWLVRVNQRDPCQGNVFARVLFNGSYSTCPCPFVRNFSTFLLPFYATENQTQFKLWQKSAESRWTPLPVTRYGIVYSLQNDIDFSCE